MRIEFTRMPVVSNPIPETVFLFVVLSWVAFMLVFLIWKRPAKAEETKRDNTSRWGILLQAFAFFVTWFVARQYFTPILPMPKPVEFVVAVLTIALARELGMDLRNRGADARQAMDLCGARGGRPQTDYRRPVPLGAQSDLYRDAGHDVGDESGGEPLVGGAHRAGVFPGREPDSHPHGRKTSARSIRR